METIKVGIIGGMGTRAGISFLQRLALFSDATSDQDFIEFIYHNNAKVPDRTRAIVYGEPSPLPELLRSVTLLNRAGSDFIFSACITSYYWFGEMQKASDCPVLHPVQLVTGYLDEMHGDVCKIGLLATTGTLHTRLFHDPVEQRKGHSVIALDDEAQEHLFMKAIYAENGLKSNRVSSEAQEQIRTAVDLLLQKGAEVLVLGCTELAMVADSLQIPVPVIDPMELMIRKISGLVCPE